MSMAFTLAYEYTGEIYPTYKRSMGLGMAGTFSRLGSIIMPFIGVYISEIGVYYPYIIFGSTCIISSILTLIFLKDTRNK